MKLACVTAQATASRPRPASVADVRALADDLDLSAARLRAEAAALRRRADELERHLVATLAVQAEGRPS